MSALNFSKMCHNKVRFATEMAGAAAAGRTTYLNQKPMRSYRCPVCEGYHITSTPKKEYERPFVMHR